MNSFFASVEQQDDPRLRGRPLAVIRPTPRHTACIAPATRQGVRRETGTPVWQARKMCPGILLQVARHREYVTMHNRIVDAVNSVIPVDRIMSIDE